MSVVVQIWDGSVWHTPGVRQSPGERIVCHVTYTRLGTTPLEDYSALPDQMFEGKPVLARLVGRHDVAGMLQITASGRDMSQFTRMTEMARGSYDEAKFNAALERAKAHFKSFDQQELRKRSNTIQKLRSHL